MWGTSRIRGGESPDERHQTSVSPQHNQTQDVSGAFPRAPNLYFLPNRRQLPILSVNTGKIVTDANSVLVTCPVGVSSVLTKQDVLSHTQPFTICMAMEKHVESVV